MTETKNKLIVRNYKIKIHYNREIKQEGEKVKRLKGSNMFIGSNVYRF